MNNSILTQSDKMSHEYCCSIVRIGEVKPIKGSDFLGQTLVDGFSVVVRKDTVKEGDIMFYASNEVELNTDFLSINNEFEVPSMNSNAKEYESEIVAHEGINLALADVNKLLSELEEDKENSRTILEDKRTNLEAELALHELKLRHMRGYFNKWGRVKLITLKKVPSFGYLFPISAMAKFCPKIEKLDFEELLKEEDRDFDTVEGVLFVKAYVPHREVKEFHGQCKQPKKHKESRLIEGEFVFHYDTQQLNKNMHRFNPSTEVTISAKIHGTSSCFAKVRVKTPKKFKSKAFTWIYNHLVPKKIRKYDVMYDNVYSSRTVIKNEYLDEPVKGGFYKTDIWGEYNKLLAPYIEDGMTVYGEIVGYLLNSETMIQKNYDYGCKIGANKFMPYRVVKEVDGKKKELSVYEVREWANELIKADENLITRIEPLHILYIGTLGELYPNIECNDSWEEKVLEALKIEKRFLMEEKEPLCTEHKVPREGIVIRINDDPIAEAFKLKCNKFLEMEGKQIDEGIIGDEELSRYDN